MSACRCTDTEVCFPCRDREAHPAPEPVTAADPALLVTGSEWRDPATGEVVRLVRQERSGALWYVESRCLRRWQQIGSRWQRVSPPPAEAPDVEPATDARCCCTRCGAPLPAHDEALAEAARLREQVAAMQAEVARRPPARFSGGAFW